MLGYGWHLNLQKPMCSELSEAERMLEAARRQRPCPAGDGELPVLRAVAEVEGDRRIGDLGAVSGYHMKMVGSGSGGWEVPYSSWEWQFKQMRRGRGILVFDDGWHKLSTALWLFGPLREVRAWVGVTGFRGHLIDAPTTIAWEHQNGIRGVWDITLTPEMYLRSDYYTNDERWEVTGSKRLLTGEPVHGPRYPATQPGDLRRRGDADLPRARRRLGQQLPGLGAALAALAPHGRGTVAVERGGGRRRPEVRLGGVRQQRAGGRRRPGIYPRADPPRIGRKTDRPGSEVGPPEGLYVLARPRRSCSSRFSAVAA